MQFRIVHALVLGAALAGVAAACEAPTAPGGAAQPRGARLDLAAAAVPVTVVQRSTPLAGPLTASATIDQHGGRLRLPEAGFSMRFPAGALPPGEAVTITVTALAGADVVYRFAPEGVVFVRDPVITQDLKLTTVFGHPEAQGELSGAYVDEASLLNGTALSDELRPTSTDVRGWKTRWSVHHFSTYVLSTSRTGGYIGSSGRL